MHDFEVSDEISMRLEPAVLSVDNAYALNGSVPTISGGNGIGLRLGLRF